MEMVVADDGTVTESDIYRAVVLNHAKLAYNSVAAWLEGRRPRLPSLRRYPDWTNSCACRIGPRRR